MTTFSFSTPIGRRSRRRLLERACALLAVFALSACGGGEPSTAAEPTPQTQATTEPEPAAGAPETATGTERDWPSLFAGLARAAEAEGRTAVVGEEGWLFFTPELRHLGIERYWGEAAAEVSRAPAEDADPLPAILDFRDQLERAGVELLFVPVPAKAALYPHRLPGLGLDERPAERVDPADLAFLERLREEGIEVVDLVPALRRAAAEGDVYCRQDTHWSPRGIEAAAAEIAGRLRGAPWLAEVPKVETARRREEVEIRGDLWRELEEPRPPQERLELTLVGREEGGGFSYLETWRESPVLLLGDSHTLVFHASGDLHARGAGLAEHLGRELGFAVDLVGVRGSGATPARVNLLRRRDQLEGKKVVVWCLSVRETTEGQGWKKVPVIPAQG